jgi:anti-sigma regulatory factor (Ser/Thr protein kinase)/serine/threonine protein phosphatase PrpC
VAQELTPESEILPVDAVITGPGDVLRTTKLARNCAAAIGFPAAHCDEIGLVVTELASNLIRHASGGTITLAPARSSGRTGIEVQSLDNGPGISDVERAITDGYSTAGGLGLGLGTVNRLMDELDISPGSSGGLHILCRRWVRAQPFAPRCGGLAFGAATRSYRLLPENGDVFLFKQWEGNALVGVIDGLGHGPLARRASQAARQYVEQHFDQTLDHVFRGAGRACHATRGVVMALARCDLARQRLTVASVGNIEVRLVGGAERFNLIVRRGIVGLNAPDPVVSEHPWTTASILVMHSDGLRTHWAWDQFRDVARETPAAIARRLLLELGTLDDDATVVVARSAE